MGMRRSARWKGKALLRGEFIVRSASQARCNAREIVNAAAAMRHAVKSAVCGSEQLFGRVAVFRKRCGPGARRERGRFGLGSHFFVNAANNTRRDVGPGFGKNDGEFVSAIARCG